VGGQAFSGQLVTTVPMPLATEWPDSAEACSPSSRLRRGDTTTWCSPALTVGTNVWKFLFLRARIKDSDAKLGTETRRTRVVTGQVTAQTTDLVRRGEERPF